MRLARKECDCLAIRQLGLFVGLEGGEKREIRGKYSQISCEAPQLFRVVECGQLSGDSGEMAGLLNRSGEQFRSNCSAGVRIRGHSGKALTTRSIAGNTDNGNATTRHGVEYRANVVGIARGYQNAVEFLLGI